MLVLRIIVLKKIAIFKSPKTMILVENTYPKYEFDMSLKQ